MQNLSDCSLGLILSFTKRDFLSSDYFRRTCSRINEKAYSIGVDRMEDAVLNLTSIISYYSKAIEIEKKIYSVESSICIETFCSSNCRFCSSYPVRNPLAVLARTMPVDWELLPKKETPRVLETADSLLQDHTVLHIAENYFLNDLQPLNPCENGKIVHIFAEKYAILSESPSEEYFIARSEAILKRIRSVGVLKVVSWKIDEKIMKYLTNDPKFKNLREVKFVNCLMLMRKEEFFTFLKSKPIEKIHLESRFKEFLIDETCLMQSNDLFITGLREVRKTPNYSEITDNLLKKWAIYPPTKVSFQYLVTSFTIRGLLDFMKAVLYRNCSSEYNLGVIGATKEEFSVLIENTKRMKKLQWDIKRCMGNWDAIVEICILPEKAASKDTADWIKKQLKLNRLPPNAETNTANDEFRIPFVLWKPLVAEEKTKKVKRIRHIKIKHRSTEKEEMTQMNQLKESNEKVPIRAWINHCQIVFGPKLLDTESLYCSQSKCLFFRLSDSTPKIRYANADRLEAYEITCLNTNQVVYIIKSLSAVEQFENIQNMIDRTAKEKSNVKTIYIPIWKSPEMATNISKSIKVTIDNDLLFAPNGFGDLAAEDGEASAGTYG